MMKALVAIMLFLAVSVFSNTTYCQDNDNEQNMETLEGRVVSVDVSGSHIVVNASVDFTFTVLPDATMTKKSHDVNDHDIELSDIDPGNYVKVDYYKDASGASMAKNITVEYNK